MVRRKGTIMFSVDDRTGNIVTNVALFAVAAVVLYVARGAFFILLLTIFFAYLLEPVVTLVQQRSWLGHKNRTWAVAQVYLIGALLVGSLGYAFGPHLVAHMKSLNAIVPEILEGLSNGTAGATFWGGRGLGNSQQSLFQNLSAPPHDPLARGFARVAACPRS